MFKTIKAPEQEPDLDGANRLFALAIDGQRFEDITREEADRRRQRQPAGEAVSVEKNVGPPGPAAMDA